MTKIEELTNKLDELYEEFDQLDELDSDYENIEELINEISEYSSEVADRVRSLEKLNEKYEEVIPQMQRELESYQDPDSEDVEREYFGDLVLEIAEEFERSTGQMESLRNEHNKNMSDEDPFAILYG